MKTTFKLSVTLLFITQALFAQYATNILGQNIGASPDLVTSAVPFLLISPDARANGMGDVGVATEPDANSAFWNPSKLPFLKDSSKIGFSFSYTPLLRTILPSINLDYVSFYYKLPKNQVIGCSFRYLSMENIEFTGNNEITNGYSDPYEYAFDFTYSCKLSFNWSIGANVRYIYSNLTGASVVQGEYTHPGQSGAIDISAYHKSNGSHFFNGDCNVSEGVCISNVGPKISYSNSGVSGFIPTDLKAGAAFHIYFNRYNKLSVMLDASKLLIPTPPVHLISAATPAVVSGMNPTVSVPQGMIQSFYDAPGGAVQEFHEIVWNTGLEYSYNDHLFLRTGFFYENVSNGGREYATAGIGGRLGNFQADVSYLVPVSQQNPLQSTFCISLSISILKNRAKENHTVS